MEMLELLRDQSQNKETSEFVNNIMSHIGEIRLYDPDWYKLPVAKLVEEEEGSEVSELMRQHADENKRLGRAKKTTEQRAPSKSVTAWGQLPIEEAKLVDISRSNAIESRTPS